MKEFSDKVQLFNYLVKMFGKKCKTIILRGSTSTKSFKNFSDFDIEVWGTKVVKPYYEIILLKEKIVLITVYFYKYPKGKIITCPKNIRLIFGEYNENIDKEFNKPKHFAKDRYSTKEKIKRECQIAIDFFFKYLRHKDKRYLDSVQKRI